MARGRRNSRWGTARISAVLVLLGFALGLSGPAAADRGPWPDRGDRARGPLAIDKINIGHDEYERSIIALTFERPVDLASLAARDFVVIELDTHGTARSDAWLFLDPERRGWRTWSYDPQTKHIEEYNFYARRTSPNSLRVTIPNYNFDPDYDRTGYRFRITSVSQTGSQCRRTCVDFVPNRSWLVHDWTPPWVSRFEVPDFSLPPGKGPGIFVGMQVTDEGYSGLRARTLWKRERGTKRWVKVTSDSITRFTRRSYPAKPGSVLELKLTGRDGAGNAALSAGVGTTRIPYDDGGTDHAPAFVGLWEQVENGRAYGGSSHTSAQPGAAFTFAAVGKFFCFSHLNGDSSARVSFVIDNSRGQSIHLVREAEGRHSTICRSFDTEAMRRATVIVEEGSVNIDAFWVE